MKKIALIAAMTVAALPAFAQSGRIPTGANAGYAAYPTTTGSIGTALAPIFMPSADRPSINPAADGNANLLNRAVPNYGNVSGGYLNAQTPRY
jgi:hypothetical protein